MIDTQPNLSLDAQNHMKDSRLAREEVERIIKGLTRFDHGVRVSGLDSTQRDTHHVLLL